MKRCLIVFLILSVPLASSADSALLAWAKQGLNAGKKDVAALVKPCSAFVADATQKAGTFLATADSKVADAALSLYGKLPAKEVVVKALKNAAIVSAEASKGALIKAIDREHWAPGVVFGLLGIGYAAPLFIAAKSQQQGDHPAIAKQKVSKAFMIVTVPCMAGMVGLALASYAHDRSRTYALLKNYV